MSNVKNKEQEFNDIYNSLSKKVYRYVYYKVQNEEEAKELHQEVFKKIYANIKSSRFNPRNTEAYVYTVAKHVIYDQWRKNMNTPDIVNIEDMQEKGFDISVNEQASEKLIVEEALNKLGKKYKSVIQLRIIDGYSVKEVAHMLNKPEGTIKSLQYRGLKKLRKILEKGGFFNE
jgi:RNA polymerase sigma-70 factor (ECF subfamily)